MTTQIDVLSPKQKLQLRFFIILWAVSALYFLWWWFLPKHFTDPLRFSFNTCLILWNVALPAYYFYFVNRMKKPNPELEIPPEWRVAMVATKTPSEPFELAVRMLTAMKAQDLQADIWLADEDPTPEMKEWCIENGVSLSTRKGVAEYHRDEWPRRTRCKEGNLAYFYDFHGYERYDFVVQMDADHIPTPSYLRNMLRPFHDPKVGYVSAPSICDSNIKTSWIARGRLYLECPWQGALQAGCNNGFVSMCIGSHYAVRTKALKEIGGLGPELAEDHSTTLLMAAGGWTGVHSIDAIAHGDGPATFADGIIQEFQWARSLFMILIQHTPRYFEKLSLRLKLQFLFGQVWYFLFSFSMLAAFILPLLAIWKEEAFAHVGYWSFLWHISLPNMASYLVVRKIKKWGILRPSNAKLLSWEVVAFQLARWPWVMYAILDAFRNTFLDLPLDWKVTPKKKKNNAKLPIQFFTPYAVIFGISLLVAALRFGKEPIDFFYLVLFNAFNYLLLSAAIIRLHHQENQEDETET